MEIRSLTLSLQKFVRSSCEDLIYFLSRAIIWMNGICDGHCVNLLHSKKNVDALISEVKCVKWHFWIMASESCLEYTDAPDGPPTGPTMPILAQFWLIRFTGPRSAQPYTHARTHAHINSTCNTSWNDIFLNSLWPSDTLWWQRSGSTLAHIMAWFCHLNQCWLLIGEVLWLSPESNFTKSTRAAVL